MATTTHSVKMDSGEATEEISMRQVEAVRAAATRDRQRNTPCGSGASSLSSVMVTRRFAER